MCMENWDDTEDMTMRCEHGETIQITEVKWWQAFLDTNCLNADLDGRPWNRCQSSQQLQQLTHRCLWKQTCIYKPGYSHRPRCPGNRSHPIFLVIVFECNSCKYLQYHAIKIVLHNFATNSQEDTCAIYNHKPRQNMSYCVLLSPFLKLYDATRFIMKFCGF